jgi:hypothetical protein
MTYDNKGNPIRRLGTLRGETIPSAIAPFHKIAHKEGYPIWRCGEDAGTGAGHYENEAGGSICITRSRK